MVSIRSIEQGIMSGTLSYQEVIEKYFSVSSGGNPFAPSVSLRDGIFLDDFDEVSGVITPYRIRASGANNGLLEFMNRLLNKSRNARGARLRKQNANLPYILIEGDSWFNYPAGYDIVTYLEKVSAIRTYAAAADTLSDMLRPSHPDWIDDLRAPDPPDYMIFSGGGNDLLGDGALDDYLRDFDPNKSAEWHLNPKFETLLSGKIRPGFLSLKNLFLSNSSETILYLHGYDLPKVFGDGSWLGKPFAARGINDNLMQEKILKVIVDRFYELLFSITNGVTSRVKIIDFRGVVPRGSEYWWDEIHPRASGWGFLFRRIQRELKLPPYPGDE